MPISSMTSSVTELMKSGEPSVPYYSDRNVPDLSARHFTVVYSDEFVIEYGVTALMLGDQNGR